MREEGNQPSGLGHGAGFVAEFVPHMETQVVPWVCLGKRERVKI